MTNTLCFPFQRRLIFGSDVDSDGTDHEAEQSDNEDPDEKRLENAKDARNYALE